MLILKSWHYSLARRIFIKVHYSSFGISFFKKLHEFEGDVTRDGVLFFILQNILVDRFYFARFCDLVYR